jgi:histidyl-tRNA synthetase
VRHRYSGEPSEPLAEIELITATTTLLGKMDFDRFTIRINDRRILKAMAASCGFPEESWDDIFITLDKMDKSARTASGGSDGAGLLPGESVEVYGAVSHRVSGYRRRVVRSATALKDFLDPKYADELIEIMESVDAVKTADFRIVFDPTLVRGMSYYTGPIFEISMDEYGGSVGGGGRYDGMIEKFIGQSVPACGFSIGFERIIMLLLERNFQVPGSREKKAYLLDKKLSPEQKRDAVARCHEGALGGAWRSMCL